MAAGKLLPKWEGPFRIIRQLAPLTYDIQEIGSLEIVRAHARHLKTYYHRYDMSLMSPDINKERPQEADQHEVSKIMAHRWDLVAKQFTYKVRWHNYTAKNDTWLPALALMDTASGALNDYLQLQLPRA